MTEDNKKYNKKSREQKPRYKQVKNCDELFNIAVFHLGEKDLSLKEMRDKLLRNVADSGKVEYVDQTIDKLLEYGYIKTDEKFSLSRADYLFSECYGKQAIKAQLVKRGIPEKVALAAIEVTADEKEINQQELANQRLLERFDDFTKIAKETLFRRMQVKFGFSRSEIQNALDEHPAAHTLRTSLEIKADKADIEKEFIKLYRKGKGLSFIKREMKSKKLDISGLDEIIDRLIHDGSVDFYQSCLDELQKKTHKYRLTDFKDANKAKAYMMNRGFSFDEINEAISCLTN
ncbi:Regulatory protein RecX [Vibrio chagasii]|nr:Regulatory protein RecX [Vibrio chagasii]